MTQNPKAAKTQYPIGPKVEKPKSPPKPVKCELDPQDCVKALVEKLRDGTLLLDVPGTVVEALEVIQTLFVLLSKNDPLVFGALSEAAPRVDPDMDLYAELASRLTRKTTRATETITERLAELIIVELMDRLQKLFEDQFRA